MSTDATRRDRPWPAVLDAARWWLLTPLLLLCGTLGTGLYAVASPALTHRELAVDQYVSSRHNAPVDVLSLTIAHALSPAGAVIIVVLVSALILWRTRSALSAAVFGWTVMCGWLAAGLLKVLVSRPRPDPTALADPLLPVVNDVSFPSGHTAFATSLVVGLVLLTLARRGPTRGRRPAVLVAVGGAAFIAAVAASRVYLGVHYPLDVAAAVPVGASGAMLGAGAARLVLTRPAIVSPGATRQASSRGAAPRRR